MNKRIQLVLAGLITIVLVVVAVILLGPKQTEEPNIVDSQAEQNFNGATEEDLGYSEARIEECCFKGWVFDNNKPVTVKLTLQNVDYPNVTRSFTGLSTNKQNEFLFGVRNDVLSYLQSKDIKVDDASRLGFTLSIQDQLYPGRYKMASATFNDKPIDFSRLPELFYTIQWTGAYERRYNPVGPEYIVHQDANFNITNYDNIHNPVTGKVYPIKPRSDGTGTFNARWSPDGKFIAYTYSAQPQQGYSSLIFNVLTPGEVYSQKYQNPGRVLLGGDGLTYEWLDNNRVVVAELIEKRTDNDNRQYYARAILQVYNARDDKFEYPMRDYIENVYSVHISPDLRRYLFEVPGNNGHVYIMTDLTGKEIKRLNSYSDDWYTK